MRVAVVDNEHPRTENPRNMGLTPNTQLGPYSILSPLGAGGMGEVYRARDTRLDREVAIKVLPAALAADKERILRFEREAKALATLSHPNIAAIYGFEEHDGKRLLIMELAEGETLAERLTRGALPLDESLETSRKIAEALEAAHDKGIVHRDLKPANIKITQDGTVKVLDFGLAKAMVGEGGSIPSMSPTEVVNSPTITAEFTRPGVILGTAGYMSPEQARGRSIDKRTDIWAFGCVLFECLSGARLFAGETVTDSLGAILHKEPEWALLPPNTPPTIQLLLRRCLAKDRNKRLRDIGDARIEIENALADPLASSLGLARSAISVEGPRRRLLSRVLMVAALLAAGAGGAALTQRFRPEPPVRKFEITAPDLQPDRGVAISPDGQKIAYVSNDQLWIRELNRLEPQPLPDSADARNPFWSPDSEYIGFMRLGQLWKSAVRGGASVLCRMNQPATGVGGAGWGENGRIVFATGQSGLYEVMTKGGDPRTLLEPNAEVGEVDFHAAAMLPDGRGALFVVHGRKGPDTISLFREGSAKVLTCQQGERLDHPLYSPTGHILYQRSGTTPGIWALPFSLSQLEVIGEPFLVVPDAVHPSFSTDGTLVYVPGSASLGLRIGWADRQGQILGAIGQPQLEIFTPALSPDGTRVAVSARDNDTFDLWIHDVSRGTKTRFTFSPRDEAGPRWTPDGLNVGYSVRGEGWAIKPADGVGPQRDMGEGVPGCFTPDGSAVVLVRMGDETQTKRDLWYIPLDGAGENRLLVGTAANETRPALSPDGRYLAYLSDESGNDEVYLTRFPGGEGKWQVSVDGGYNPRWSRNGTELLFTQSGSLMSTEVQTEPSLVLGKPTKLFDGEKSGIHLWRGYDAAPEGDRLIVIYTEGQTQSMPNITVVENWFAEFKDRP